MKLYIYDENTGEFVRESIAKLNLEKSRISGKKIYEIPKNSTDKEPVFAGKDEVCIFENNNWIVKKDFRGKKFFDTKTSKTILIDYIGEIPESYILLGTKEFNDYLKVTDTNLIRNNIREKIEELYNLSLQKVFCIDKYYFQLKDFDKYKNVKNEVVQLIMDTKERINNLENMIKEEPNIEKRNKLVEKQLDMYNDLDNLTIKLSVMNKRKKSIEITYTYPQFSKLYNKLCTYKNLLDTNREKEINALKLVQDSELVLFEQGLCRRGINFDETKGNEKGFKNNS